MKKLTASEVDKLDLPIVQEFKKIKVGEALCINKDEWNYKTPIHGMFAIWVKRGFISPKIKIKIKTLDGKYYIIRTK